MLSFTALWLFSIFAAWEEDYKEMFKKVDFRNSFCLNIEIEIDIVTEIRTVSDK